MDLGILAPAAVVTGVGLGRGAAWARKPMYAIVGAYALLGASVAGTAVTMVVKDDPDASVAVAAGFAVFAAVFGALAVVLYRPLFRPPADIIGALAAPEPVPNGHRKVVRVR